MNSRVLLRRGTFVERAHSTETPTSRSNLSYDAGQMTGDLLLCLLDFVCLFGAAALSTAVYTHGLIDGPVNITEIDHAPWVAAVLAPFVLYDKRFGTFAIRGRVADLARPFALRFTLFAAVVLTLAAVTQTLDHFPFAWLLIWFFASLFLTLLSRVVVATAVRTLQRRGTITEVIAVVGAGPVADRLVQALRQNRPDTVELLGIFDDRYARAETSLAPVGNLAQLIELGKTRKIDWILLALPPTAELRLLAIVKRLMSLSVPIGLCPQHVGSTLPYRVVDYAADTVPVSLLADRPIRRWDAFVKGAEDILPRWTITFALLPLKALGDAVAKRRRPALVHQFDNYDLERFAAVAASFGHDRCGYVVTPNADHIIRLHESTEFRTVYAAADYVLLDSRFLSHVLRVTKGLKLPVCAGSDLTAKLFSNVIQPTDALVMIGGTTEQVAALQTQHRLQRIAHFNPPMGFINDPAAVETCLAFIEAHSPFRFCLLAVGTPQQELLAQALKARGTARGLVLCVGASINFLTGVERRAPRWMRRCGAEWLFRLLHAPGRLAHRYLVRGPRVFALLQRDRITLRSAPAPVLQIIASSAEPIVREREGRDVQRDVLIVSSPLVAAPMERERPRVSAAS